MLPENAGITSISDPAPSPARLPRLQSVDLLRGVVMVLMALDHTRGFFFHAPFSPLDLRHTFPALFLTRWVTHFCAPVFVFLAGTGARLSTRGRTTGDLSWFLLTRGLWLVLLEVTYVNWGWTFSVTFHGIGAMVIWVIGWSMVVLAALIWLPSWAIAAFGLGIIALHDCLDGVLPHGFGAAANLWRVLYAGGSFDLVPGVKCGVAYPLIPWAGVMAAGYGLGALLLRDAAVRRRWLLGLGAALTVMFVVIRSTNLYGDPTPWSPQQDALFTVLSFLNCEKYPPSLCFLLMTLGPALLFLGAFDGRTPTLLKPILLFGRVPLFYYLLHLPLIHGLARAAEFIHGNRADGVYGIQPGVDLPAVAMVPSPGFGLPVVYGIWIAVLVLLYPVCRRFAAVKQARRDTWLRYL